jgi:hypothetical protein
MDPFRQSECAIAVVNDVTRGAQMADFEPIPYRIRIGVTGHRNLDDPAAVQSAVKKAIDAEIEKLFPGDSRRTIERVRRAGTTPVSFRVLSPLAEGADRVVALAVLDFPGARLDVVLPLALEDYLEDFATEESKEQFRDLLARCRKPSLSGRGVSETIAMILAIRRSCAAKPTAKWANT